jgi:DNA-binding beta-propeller fold protein YncE
MKTQGGQLTAMGKILPFIAVATLFIGAIPRGDAQTPVSSPYVLASTSRVGGEGGFDYVYAESAGRRLYISRPGSAEARITVFDLDTLAPAGEIAGVNARGVAVDPVAHHGFASSKPVTMWDTRTLAIIKTIPVEGGPDGILFDPFNGRVWVFSHRSPNATIINSTDGSVVGTMDLGGEPEQAATDIQGRLYVDIEDKDEIAVIDAKSLAVTARYGLEGKGGGPGGLALDAKHGVLFASCHKPATMVIIKAETGQILAVEPIGRGTDGALFNPETCEAFSSNGADGTLSVIKESSPTSFSVEQTLSTMGGARTSTLDFHTGRVFLISAEFGPAPSPPPQGGWVRRPMIPGTFTILTVAR